MSGSGSQMPPGSGPSESFELDRSAVRAAFDRASAHYDAAASLQRQVREALLERLDLVAASPGVVLDLGSGPGQATLALARRYRRATVIAVDFAPGMAQEARRTAGFFRRFTSICADARRLPLRDASVDLVFSSLMLQWCADPLPAFAEIRRVLKPDGLLAFTTFGPDTLHELRAAWAAADGRSHVSRFLDVHDVGDTAARAGLTEPVLDVDRMIFDYPDALTLMQELKTIGARNALASRSRGLTGRSALARMTAAYEGFRREGGLPATYEIIFGVAWGGSERRASPQTGGETAVPLSSIRRSRRE